jgi:hypothetical protein
MREEKNSWQVIRPDPNKDRPVSGRWLEGIYDWHGRIAAHGLSQCMTAFWIASSVI